MYEATPIRQLRQLYRAILALGRLPDAVASIRDAVATNGATHAAALQEIADKVCVQSAAPVVDVPPPIVPTAALDEFRRTLLSKIERRLLCVDVGARWGVDSALLALKGKAKLLCFDPDEEECARLQAGHSIDELEYVPIALSSDGRDLSLTITQEPACSSIYPPIKSLYTNYPALAQTAPAQVVAVASTSLDQFLASRDLGKPHLFKVDTQGSELDILRGSVANLSEVCMIDIEVEFNPIYQGQALFWEVDAFMREQGFVLWRLPQMVHYSPVSVPAAETPVEVVAYPPSRVLKTNPGNGQLFWGQAHYVRADLLPSSDAQLSLQPALRAAAIASAYGYWDLALMALQKSPEAGAEARQLQSLLK